MKNLRFIIHSIMLISCISFLYLTTNAMDSLETPSSAQQTLSDQTFVVKHTNDDAIEGMEISKTILQMSKTLKDLLADVGESTSEAIIIPPSPNDPSPIRTMDLVFECLELSRQGISIESEVKRSSLSGLVYALNLIHFLDIDDPQINETFEKTLKQRLSTLSPEELSANKHLIDSSDSNALRNIRQQLLSEAISCKKIEILKQKGIAPENYTVMQLNFNVATRNALNHNGTKIALSSGPEKNIDLLDVPTGEKIRTFSGIRAHNSPLLLQFTHDGKCLIAKEEDNIKIWDIDTGKLLQSLEHKDVTNMLLSLNDTFIASASDEKIIIWQKNKTNDTYIKLYTINEYDHIYDFSSDETQLIVSKGHAGYRGIITSNNINIWNIIKREFLSQSPLTTSNSYPILQFSPQNDDLFRGKNNKLTINNIDIFERKKGGEDNQAAIYSYINLSPDKKIYIEKLTFSRGEEPKIFLLDSINNSSLCEIKTQGRGINTRETVSAIFSHDNNTIALWDDTSSSSGKKTLLIVKLLTQEDKNELEGLQALPLFELLLSRSASCGEKAKI